MSMRSQVYEWTGSRTDGGGTALAAAQAGKRIQVFIGGYGNNITKPAETTATQLPVGVGENFVNFNVKVECYQ